METPEEFLKHYHNNLSNDWLFEKREVVARLIKEYAEQALRIHDVEGRSEELLALAQYMCEHQNNLDGKTAKDYLQDFLSQ